jgi:hypothetical protein
MLGIQPSVGAPDVAKRPPEVSIIHAAVVVRGVDGQAIALTLD